MTRDHAAEQLRALAAGLGPGDDGIARLLERISVRPDCEQLRAALVVAGATGVLLAGASAPERVSAAPVAAGAPVPVGCGSRSAGRA